MATTRRMAFFVFVGTATLFLLTAHYRTGQVGDTQAAIWPAWEFVHHGTFKLDHVAGLPTNTWFIHANGHLVSQRAMGVVLLGVPVCALLSWTNLTPAELNAITGALLSAAAIGALSATFRKLVQPRLALAAAVVVGFGTSIWTVAGTETWPQTGDALFLALALLAIADERLWWAGLALSPTVLIRPHLALVAFIMGIGLGIRERSLRAPLAFGLPSIAAFLLLFSWNHWMFGGWQLLGAYDAHVNTLAPSSWGVSAYAENAAGAFFSPLQGLFLFTPVALLAIWWIYRGFTQIPVWTRLALVAGLAYEALQLQLDIFTGGGAFYGSRLIIELVVLASPAVVASYQIWSAGRLARRFVTWVVSALGIAIFSFGALLAYYLVGTTAHQRWFSFYPVRVFQSAGVNGVLVAVPIVACFLIAALDRYRSLFRARTTAQS